MLPVKVTFWISEERHMASNGLGVLAKEVVKTLKTPGGNLAREARSGRARHLRDVRRM